MSVPLHSPEILVADPSTVAERRRRIGIRHIIDHLRDQRQLIVSQLERPDAPDPLRLVAHIQSFDARIALLVEASGSY